LRLQSPLYPYPLSERTLKVHGAPTTVVGEVAELTVVSIRFSNVRLPVQATADFASLIHSQQAPQAQPTATQRNREGVIGATIKEQSADSMTGAF
jgi:hypothetical protein